MSTTAVSFFETEQNKAILRRFAQSLGSTPAIEHPTPDVIPPLKQLLNIIIPHTSAFDQHCSANIEWIGQQFIGQMSNFPELALELRKDALLSIFTSAYRFLCELEFSQPGDLSFELRAIKLFVEKNLLNFPEDERSQLVYANYIMPATVAKRLIHSPALAEFKSFAETASAASELKATWDKEIKDKNEEIATLRDVFALHTVSNLLRITN